MMTTGRNLRKLIPSQHLQQQRRGAQEKEVLIVRVCALHIDPREEKNV